MYLCTSILKEIEIIEIMKKGIHPETYRFVIFRDISTSKEILTRSTVVCRENATWSEDGKEYPLYKLEISSDSHPYFTGKMKFIDTAGRIDKFNKKFSKFAKKNKVTIEE